MTPDRLEQTTATQIEPEQKVRKRRKYAYVDRDASETPGVVAHQLRQATRRVDADRLGLLTIRGAGRGQRGAVRPGHRLAQRPHRSNPNG